jgi:signal peptide peptidase SppA
MQNDAWFMEPVALNVLIRRLSDASFDASCRVAGVADVSPMRIADGVAMIPISGVLMKSVPPIYRRLGIEATGYDEIAANVRAAVQDPSVKTISLRISSPGGQAGSLAEAGDAIYAAGKVKPIHAYVEDIGASAAYWLAAQAKTIHADQNAMVGSIGAYSVYLDTTKMMNDMGVTVHMVRSGDHKGVGQFGVPITEDQLATKQTMIDKLADNFTSAVARGRNKSLEDIKSLSDGRLWIASDAMKNGLIDGVGSLESSPAGVRQGANLNTGDKQMADEKVVQTAAPDIEAIKKQAADQARLDEWKRMADLKAAFPSDPAFAMAQFEAGATVDQAKATYCDIAQTRMAEMQEKLDAQAAKPPVTKPAGVGPVPQHGDPSASEKSFLTMSQEYAEEKGISLTAAMKKINVLHPGLYGESKAKAMA